VKMRRRWGLQVTPQNALSRRSDRLSRLRPGEYHRVAPPGSGQFGDLAYPRGSCRGLLSASNGTN